MYTRNDITPEIMRQLLTYDATSGNLTWLERSTDMTACRYMTQQVLSNFNVRYSGKPAFTATAVAGYKVGSILGVGFTAHRVAWAIHHGAMPAMHIDHINADKADNRICNLRDVSNQQNHKNQRIRYTNTSGRVGVCWSKAAKKWVAQITISGASKGLGYFTSFDDAARARAAAEVKYCFHPNHGRARHGDA